MKPKLTLCVIVIILIYNSINAQSKEINLAQFTMENSSSPAFLLVEETPTAIYTPENVRALAIHVLDNLGESISIEIAPYFFLNTKSKKRTYFNYIGVEKNEDTNELKQKPLSGLNTTTLSFAFVDKNLMA